MRPPSLWRKRGLLRIQLDDQLLLDRLLDVRASREDLHGSAEVAAIQLQPGRDPFPDDGVQGLVHRGDLPALLPEFDDVPGPDQERGNVHLAPVHEEVPVAHDLPAFPSRLGEPELVRHVVEPALEEDQQVVAGLSLHPVGLLEIGPELLLEDPVYPLGFLLLPQLDPVIAVLGTALPVLSRGVPPPLDRALVGEAAVPLEVELDPLT